MSKVTQVTLFALQSTHKLCFRYSNCLNLSQTYQIALSHRIHSTTVINILTGDEAEEKCKGTVELQREEDKLDLPTK